MVVRLTFSHPNYAFFSESQSGPAKNVIIQKSNRQSACICDSWQCTVNCKQLHSDLLLLLLPTVINCQLFTSCSFHSIRGR